ncbi:MAG TPA: glycoside hydrolase family 16 protein, partial [Actinoplanes sp.]|nr:glycoside hydrolase family 16 protein [Actinoplanes sp.]
CEPKPGEPCPARLAGPVAQIRPGTGKSSGAVDPSGRTMPVGDLPGWRQIFADNFATDVPLGSFPARVAHKWDAYPDGWRDTSKNGTYMPSKVISVRNGVMDLHLRTENGRRLVAAPTPKPASRGQLYGRYAVRFKADPVAGYKVAWLLWPLSEQWSEGEIDFPEGNLNSRIWGFMHHRGDPLAKHSYRTKATFASWHTAVIEWTPEHVKFILDGTTVGTTTDRSTIPNKPMRWVLQTETVLDGTVPRATATGHVLIDWVAMYSRVP